MTSRRTFLSTTSVAAAGLGLGLGPGPVSGFNHLTRSMDPRGARSRGRANPLKLLFLGGTGFLGPAEVEYALQQGHEVTLFNRGRTNTHLFPGVEKLVGDRSVPDYSALEGRTWDAVLDTSANRADWVKEA